MAKVVNEKVAVEKVKQKLNGGGGSPKKSKQSEIETINRKTSRSTKPDGKLDEARVKRKPSSRSSSPRKKEVPGKPLRSRSPSKSPRKERLSVSSGVSRSHSRKPSSTRPVPDSDTEENGPRLTNGSIVSGDNQLGEYQEEMNQEDDESSTDDNG